MSWERGAWEKKTSNGAKYIKNDSSSYHENITSNSYVRETYSGKLVFCPNCGSMMRRKYGVLTCTMCGYSSSEHFSENTSQYDIYEQYQTKNQMNEVLRVMGQGKTRSQAAQILDIPLSKINRWYQQGSNGIDQHFSHFYRELKYIEENRERRRREEINRKNREIENRKRRARQEREERNRKERLRKQKSDSNIKRQMDSIRSQMRNGKTRQQAASYAGVSRSIVDQWYDKGRFGNAEPYKSFYNDVSRIEKRRVKSNKSKNNTFIKCPKCGKFYNSSKIHCPHCQKGTASIKTKISYSRERTEKMANVLSLMRTGLSRYEAAQKVGLSVVTVNNWYSKGSRGELAYKDFYNNVKSIEGTSNMYDKSSEMKSTASNYIKCSKCGNKYNKAVNEECPHCKNTKSKNFIKCPKCNKFYKKDKKQCPHCSKSKTKSSFKVNKRNNKTSGEKPTTSTNNNKESLNWKICCVLGLIVFVLFVILFLLVI